MNLPTRIAVHLTVVGCALVAAAARPGHPSVAPDAAPKRTATAALFTSVTATPTAATPSAASRPQRTRRSRNRPPAAHAITRRGRRTPPLRHPAHRRRAAADAPAVDGPTSWSALNRAIAAIPSYRPGIARWTVSRRYGHWGTADWYHAVLYVSPTVPSRYLYDVAVHEWSHELSVLDYDGDVSRAVAAMNSYFGGSGLTGAERAADCMAVLQGATWTHYTTCLSAPWRAGAARLLRGEQL